jgi:hypothetical protein
MATILRSYDWSIVSRNNKRARSRSYPWDDWFDGRIWELHPGEDFDGPTTSLERVIRTSANRRDIKVRIRIDDGNVIVQMHNGDSPLRSVTKSPSAKSIKAAREAATTNGSGPVTTTKTPAKRIVATKRPTKAVTKTPTPRKRIVKATA